MNPLTNIKNTQKMNEKELELGLIGKKSWHDQYKDSAWIFIGGLPYDLTEGDIIAVFSQYGELVNINLVRDAKTGKSKGFCFVCYEDQRSTILAVDNLNGMKLLGRTVRVDHVENYKVPKEHENDDEVTRKIRMEGIAPKAEEEKSEEEEDYVIPLKKQKKDKKAKKKKKKNKKKGKDNSDSDSESSHNVSKKKKTDKMEQQREQTSVERRKNGDRDVRERSPVRQREAFRDRDSRPSPDRQRAREDRYRDNFPRGRERESPRRRDPSPRDRRDTGRSPPPKNRDPSPRRYRSDRSPPQRRDRKNDRDRDGDRKR